MAEKRMFSKRVIDSDAFLDMPLTTQALYFHLNMRADDDGFVNNPKKIMRMIGAGTDDLNVLLAKRFVLGFESGVIVIKHWRMHNYIQNDRYKETAYLEEKSHLILKVNKAYSFMDTECIQDVSSLESQIRLAKNRIDKNSIDKNRIDKRFTPPTLEEVQAYCDERKNNVDAERFVDYYASQKWKKANGQPVADWKACIRTWEKRSKTGANGIKLSNEKDDILDGIL